MKSAIGGLIYFVSSVLSVLLMLAGVFMSASSNSAGAGITPVITAGVLYWIGRDIRKCLREPAAIPENDLS